MAGELQVVLVGLADFLALPGGEQVEEQSAGNGEMNARLDPGSGLIGSPLDQFAGQPIDPAVHARLEEVLAPRPAEERVRIQLEEQPFPRPRLRVGEVLEELPRLRPAVQCAGNVLVDRVADRGQQPLLGSEVVQQHAMAGADGRRDLTQALADYPAVQRLLYRGCEHPFPRLRRRHASLYRMVHVPDGTKADSTGAS
jgi:hypothetical protein